MEIKYLWTNQSSDSWRFKAMSNGKSIFICCCKGRYSILWFVICDASIAWWNHGSIRHMQNHFKSPSKKMKTWGCKRNNHLAPAQTFVPDLRSQRIKFHIICPILFDFTTIKEVLSHKNQNNVRGEDRTHDLRISFSGEKIIYNDMRPTLWPTKPPRHC